MVIDMSNTKESIKTFIKESESFTVREMILLLLLCKELNLDFRELDKCCKRYN